MPQVLLDQARRKEAVPAAQIGTATHLVLARLDLSSRPDRRVIEKTIEILTDEETLSPQTACRIDIPAILSFFNSPLGDLTLRNAAKVLREWPFTLGLSASQAGLGRTSEKIILQGIVDMIIPTPEGLVLIDFKTDRISEGQLDDRAAHYAPQIRYYALAARKILAQPVAAAHFFFLALSKSVSAGL
jgi:ATP-dependent helicase/nuclease subunit A